jgi:uncharacterized phage-associated protein
MTYEPRATANLLLDLADELRLPLTHMALHKVAYYAHGWRLAASNVPLLTDEFEAWEHGPVLSTVYNAFKGAGREAIRGRAYRFDPVSQQRSIATAAFLMEDRAFLRDIVKAYGRLDALTLSDMTHRRGGPWDLVWNAGGGRVTLGMRIKNEAIRSDFLEQPIRDRQQEAKAS